MSNRDPNRMPPIGRHAQFHASGRSQRLLAKAYRRSLAHQQERAKLNQPIPKKCLKDRVILINVIGGLIVYSLVLFASYSKQVVVNINPASISQAWDYCMQLVGV